MAEQIKAMDELSGMIKINGELAKWLRQFFAKEWPGNWAIGSNPIPSAILILTKQQNNTKI